MRVETRLGRERAESAVRSIPRVLLLRDLGQKLIQQKLRYRARVASRSKVLVVGQVLEEFLGAMAGSRVGKSANARATR